MFSLVGKIKFKLLSQGPLAEWVKDSQSYQRAMLGRLGLQGSNQPDSVFLVKIGELDGAGKRVKELGISKNPLIGSEIYRANPLWVSISTS